MNREERILFGELEQELERTRERLQDLEALSRKVMLYEGTRFSIKMSDEETHTAFADLKSYFDGSRVPVPAAEFDLDAEAKALLKDVLFSNVQVGTNDHAIVKNGLLRAFEAGKKSRKGRR